MKSCIMNNQFLPLSYLSIFFLLLRWVWSTTKSLRNVPERNIHQLGFHNQIELIGLFLYSFNLVLSQLHQAIDVSLEAGIALWAPLKPQLEDVIMTTALENKWDCHMLRYSALLNTHLNDFITSIVTDIIELVSHEQIFGWHWVTTKQ